MTLFGDIKDEIYKALKNLGANSDLLSIVGSWRDTLNENDILAELQRYNNGVPFEVIAESDDVILFDAEQKAKQKVPLQEYHELIDRIGEAMENSGIAEIVSQNGTVIRRGK